MFIKPNDDVKYPPKIVEYLPKCLIELLQSLIGSFYLKNEELTEGRNNFDNIEKQKYEVFFQKINIDPSIFKEERKTCFQN